MQYSINEGITVFFIDLIHGTRIAIFNNKTFNRKVYHWERRAAKIVLR